MSTFNNKMRIEGFESLVQAVNALAPNTAESIGELIYNQTPAEISVGVTPTAYRYPPGDVRRYGALLNNSADDATAIQRACDVQEAAGGGRVFGFNGATARVSTGIIVKDGVTLDLEGGIIRATLTASNDFGVRLRNYASVINGEVSVESGGSPASQAMGHCAVAVGGFYGGNGTVASPSVDEGVTGWTARNLKLNSNKSTGGVCIQVNGGANNGLIENIEAPASSTLFGVVMLDWSALGTLSASDIPAGRTAFDAGTMYTTHPHNIVIRNIKAGALTRANTGVDTGSRLVRLSGVYNVTVENVRGVEVTYCVVHHTAGDVGFEFAPAAIKPLAHKGIRIENATAEDCNNGYVVLCDCWADNVSTAVTGGYSPLLNPVAHTDIEFIRCGGVGSGTGSAVEGFRFDHIQGGTVRDCWATGFRHGVLVDEQVFGLRIVGKASRYYGNQQWGIYVHHGTNKPQDVVIDGPHCFQNDQSATTKGGIGLEGCIRTLVQNCELGHRTAASETTQTYGIRIVSTACENATIQDNYAHSVDTGGVAYSVLSSTDYGSALRLFRNNLAASAITNKYGGLDILPVDLRMHPDGTTRRTFVAAESVLTGAATPTAGTWVQGDTIYYTDPDANDFIGTVCTTGGSPGTWKRFGVAEA